MLFRLQEGMIFGLHWLCEKMLFEFASVIPYVAQLRRFAAFQGGGNTRAGFFPDRTLPTFGFANREINRNTELPMLKFQLWLCLCFLLGLLPPAQLKGLVHVPQTAGVNMSFLATESTDHPRHALAACQADRQDQNKIIQPI